MARNSGSKLALSAIVGAAVGYVTGILTAPKSGRETRTDVANKAGSVKSGAEAQLQDVIDDLSGTINGLKGKTMAMSAKAREEYDESLIKAKDAQNKATAVLKAVKAGEASDPELNKAVKQGRQALKNLSRFLKN